MKAEFIFLSNPPRGFISSDWVSSEAAKLIFTHSTRKEDEISTEDLCCMSILSLQPTLYHCYVRPYFMYRTLVSHLNFFDLIRQNRHVSEASGVMLEILSMCCSSFCSSLFWIYNFLIVYSSKNKNRYLKRRSKSLHSPLERTSRGKGASAQKKRATKSER